MAEGSKSGKCDAEMSLSLPAISGRQLATLFSLIYNQAISKVAIGPADVPSSVGFGS